jgi:endoglucanase
MKLLKDLCLAISPSNNEDAAIKVWDEYCKTISGSKQVYQDHLKNSVWSLGNGGSRKILLSAHIDTVYATVTKITDKGTLMFSQGAGICLKSLISGRVLVSTETNTYVPGVVQKIALHIDDDRKKVGDWLDYRINIGCCNKKQVEELGIFPGCQIIYHPEINTEFGHGFIHGTGLDDKAGIWIVGECMKNLVEKIPEEYTVYFGACTQEETGLNGAKRVAKNLNPDISIDIDCTFADSELAGKEFKDLDLNLGDGALIAYGPEKSKRLCDIMRETAKENSIPFKTYATRAGGTNTKSFQDFAIDCECGLLSFGLLSMHSSNEIVKKDDLINCSNLLTKLIENSAV